MWGYSLAFGEGNAVIGDLGNLFLAGVGRDAMSGTIPETVFVMFQITFAIITPALVVGGFAEGMGTGSQLLVQLVGVAATLVWTAVVTFVVLKVVDAITGPRARSSPVSPRAARRRRAWRSR